MESLLALDLKLLFIISDPYLDFLFFYILLGAVLLILMIPVSYGFNGLYLYFCDPFRSPFALALILLIVGFWCRVIGLFENYFKVFLFFFALFVPFNDSFMELAPLLSKLS
jgi:hypothetical protein